MKDLLENSYQFPMFLGGILIIAQAFLIFSVEVISNTSLLPAP